MKEAELQALGTHACAILTNESFLILWDVIVEQTGQDVLRTSLDAREEREDLYLTYHGMRTFFQKLQGFKSAADNIRLMENQEETPTVDDTD